MLAELRTLSLPSGEKLDTPLLVPSFSSKGFGRIDSEVGRSEASAQLEYFGPELHQTLLVSGYDLHYGLLAVGDLLREGRFAETLLARPKLVIIDSGGYESRQGTDAGELIQEAREPEHPDWDESTYAALLDQVPETSGNCAAVTFDRPGESYETQLRAGQELLGARQYLMKVMLLKAPSQHHDFDQLTPAVSRLAGFDIVGVTEHELGNTLIDRIQAIADLRELLTRSRLALPIHVFGALDPLFVPLYFAAGADIFDGLTWLRYAYWHGLALHREQGALLNEFLHQRDDIRQRLVPSANLRELENLATRLMRFAREEQDWSIFDDVTVGAPDGRVGGILRDAYLSAMARRRG